eukprot:966192-Amphidinium_carterae.1
MSLRRYIRLGPLSIATAGGGGGNSAGGITGSIAMMDGTATVAAEWCPQGAASVHQKPAATPQ